MGMTTDQVDGGREKARAGAGRLHPDLLVLTVQEVIRTVPDKLGQRMAWIGVAKREIGSHTGLHLRDWTFQGDKRGAPD